MTLQQPGIGPPSKAAKWSTPHSVALFGNSRRAPRAQRLVRLVCALQPPQPEGLTKEQQGLHDTTSPAVQVGDKIPATRQRLRGAIAAAATLPTAAMSLAVSLQGKLESALGALPPALPLSPAILAGAVGSLEAAAVGKLSDRLHQLAVALAAATKGDWSKLLALLYVAIALAWRSSLPRSPYLQGGYAPVRDERLDRGLVCEQGRLPPDLAGWYARAGPNPYFDPPAAYHWWDGDGMVHGVRLDGAAPPSSCCSATYANAWVNTVRLQKERHAGSPMLCRLGDLAGRRGVAIALLNLFAVHVGAIRREDGVGTANTSLLYHAGRLMAMHDADMPYELRLGPYGAISTAGRLDADRLMSRLREGSSCSSSSSNSSATSSGSDNSDGGSNRSSSSSVAVEGRALPPLAAIGPHAKVDPRTGELLFVSVDLQSQPYTVGGVLGPDGYVTHLWPLDLPYPVLMHDMAVTANYLVVLYLPLCFDTKNMMLHDSAPLGLRSDLPNLIGLVPRDQPSCGAGQHADVRWFQLPGPGVAAMHMVNAWEEGEQVKIYVCQLGKGQVELDEQKCDLETAHLTEYTLHLGTAEAAARQLSHVSADFPVVHPDRVSRPCRYTWMATLATQGRLATMTGIAKFDLQAPDGQDACVARIFYPPGWEGGEATFVPRSRAGAVGRPQEQQDGPQGQGQQCEEQQHAEDDGYLMVYVSCPQRDVSYLHVYDAASMSDRPLAAVRMPRRVPHGFHGTWLTQEELAAVTDGA